MPLRQLVKVIFFSSVTTCILSCRGARLSSYSLTYDDDSRERELIDSAPLAQVHIQFTPSDPRSGAVRWVNVGKLTDGDECESRVSICTLTFCLLLWREFLKRCLSPKARNSNPDCEVIHKLRSDDAPPVVAVEFGTSRTLLTLFPLQDGWSTVFYCILLRSVQLKGAAVLLFHLAQGTGSRISSTATSSRWTTSLQEYKT